MATTEESHHGMLSALYREKFGEHLPPIRREDVKGFLRRRPLWWTTNLSVDAIRREMEVMELLGIPPPPGKAAKPAAKELPIAAEAKNG